MPHCRDQLRFGIGVEICGQHHGVARKAVNQDNGQQTVRATETALHNGQPGLSLPSVIDHFCFVFSLIFRAEFSYRMLFNTITGAHSPDETVELDSVKRVWEFLLELLKS